MSIKIEEQSRIQSELHIMDTILCAIEQGPIPELGIEVEEWEIEEIEV